MKKTRILILNGPNLNLLGEREPEKYGTRSFESYIKNLIENFPNFSLEFFQSNIEGEIINKIHESMRSHQGIIINAGGYSHTSVAIRDALTAVNIPAIEVHITNIYTREDFRKQLLISPVCKGIITGFGLYSYDLALKAIEQIINRAC
ncbi:MAG: type II 3-dehydroquinate dehydratase [Bacteroidales bacterium]|nr:type II 3-dehydroquinate dehydratase [Bacteroidales bacterium]